MPPRVFGTQFFQALLPANSCLKAMSFENRYHVIDPYWQNLRLEKQNTYTHTVSPPSYREYNLVSGIQSRSLHGVTQSRTITSSCQRRGATASGVPSTCTPIPRAKRGGACCRRSLASSGPSVRKRGTALAGYIEKFSERWRFPDQIHESGKPRN